MHGPDDMKLLLYAGSRNTDHPAAVAYAFYLNGGITVTQCVYLADPGRELIRISGDYREYTNSHGLKGYMAADGSRNSKYCGCRFALNGMLYHVYACSPESLEQAESTMLKVMELY